MLRKGRIRHLLGGRILESFEMKHVVLTFMVALGTLAFAQQGAFRSASDHIETKTPSDLQQHDQESLYLTDRAPIHQETKV